MCSDSQKPDPLIGEAARDNVNLAREMTQYFRQKDKEQAPRQARMDDLTERLANQQISTSRFNDTQARAMWDRYQNTGIPIENAVNAEAMDYDSTANLDKAAGEAGNDVAVAMAQSQRAQERNLARMGVNPADGRALASGDEMATTSALAQAQAMNGARTQRSTMGAMLRKDAASMARGMPGTAAQTFGVAGAAGGQAAGAVGSAISSASQIASTMGTGMNGAINANNSAGSVLAQQYRDLSSANSAENSSTMQGVGSIAAAAAMAF